MPTFKSPYTIPHDHKPADISGLSAWMGEVQKEFDARDAQIQHLRDRQDQLICAVVILVVFAAVMALLLLVNS